MTVLFSNINENYLVSIFCGFSVEKLSRDEHYIQNNRLSGGSSNAYHDVSC